MTDLLLDTQTQISERQLAEAILETIVYADCFDYPLTAAEIHRYLHGVRAGIFHIQEFLASRPSFNQVKGYYHLAGRQAITSIRQNRADIAATYLPRAARYGCVLGSIPFVRMVALTGSLAVSNSEKDADFDYFIITAPGRLWLCRALVILFVRWVEWLFHDTLCPNFLISEEAMQLPYRNIYTAHEVAQMVPITGLHLYHQFRAENAWTDAYLPNAIGLPDHASPAPAAQLPVKAGIESVLTHPGLDRLEAWEMGRKIRRYQLQAGNQDEIRFSPHWCQGHFSGHAHRTLQEFEQKLARISTRIGEL